MKVVLPAILLLEAIVVALAIPVALAFDDRGPASAIVLGVLAVLLALGSGLVRRPRGVAVGWMLQGLVVLSGLLVPAMAVLGAIFLGVWVLGVIYGAKGDALAARNRATEAAWQAEQAASAALPSPSDPLLPDAAGAPMPGGAEDRASDVTEDQAPGVTEDRAPGSPG